MRSIVSSLAYGSLLSLSSRSVATAAARKPIALVHPLPPQQISRVVNLTVTQRKEARELRARDPVAWTNSKLAEHFHVPVAVIQATVPLPTRREWKVPILSILLFGLALALAFSYHRKMTKDMGPYGQREKTPNQQKIDTWIYKQIGNTLEHRAQRKVWKRTAAHERFVNTDIRWLKSVEDRLAKLQQKSQDKLVENRKRRAQAL